MIHLSLKDMDKRKYGKHIVYAEGEYRVKSAAEEVLDFFRKHGYPAIMVKRKTGYQVYTTAEAYKWRFGT